MEQPEKEKKIDVELMFNSIARRYDFLNHFLSFGYDRYWRRKAIKIVAETLTPSFVLDVATGTGDLAVEAVKLNPVKITGIDISEKMLALGRKKIQKKGLSGKIELISGNSENLPFDDNSFDLVMTAFGIRNFNDILKGLREMTRVLNGKGMLMILEFSIPVSKLFRRLFGFYFFRILPLAGRLLSGHLSAYRYLPESVESFPDREKFARLMLEAGLKDVTYDTFTGGIVTIYRGLKVKS
ncbi:MAG: bifunctional demethylmenaquinone methyltransferase/2-methoxy-6-polyprenyl-1,4-benzoquinol methylase UbiE [Bacteroidales bacterium]